MIQSRFGKCCTIVAHDLPTIAKIMFLWSVFCVRPLLRSVTTSLTWNQEENPKPKLFSRFLKKGECFLLHFERKNPSQRSGGGLLSIRRVGMTEIRKGPNSIMTLHSSCGVGECLHKSWHLYLRDMTARSTHFT